MSLLSGIITPKKKSPMELVEFSEKHPNSQRRNILSITDLSDSKKRSLRKDEVCTAHTKCIQEP